MLEECWVGGGVGVDSLGEGRVWDVHVHVLGDVDGM